MRPLEILARPFAAFFEEAAAPAWVVATIDRPRPSPSQVGLARIPALARIHAPDRFEAAYCCECLNPDCTCD